MVSPSGGHFVRDPASEISRLCGFVTAVTCLSLFNATSFFFKIVLFKMKTQIILSQVFIIIHVKIVFCITTHYCHCTVI